MTEDPKKIRAKVAALNRSLDELETKLEPLLSQSLPETLLGLETIQQAKLQVAIPYVVYDLVFIFLKTRGIDPKTHPVINELDRIRQYFDKIKNVEDPEKRKTAVDKAAANRFIKHAIAQIKQTPAPSEGEPGPSTRPSNTHIRFDQGAATDIPIKVTSKMLARAQYEKELKEQVSEEEDDLEVFEDDEDAEMDEEDRTPQVSSPKAKGKGKATDEDVSQEVTGRKRRRPPMDPFQGYGDVEEPASHQESIGSSTKGNGDASSDGSTSPSSSSSTSQSEVRRRKNAAKKARKRAKRAGSISVS